VGGLAAQAPVDAQRLQHADAEPRNWLTTGRTYDEQHFSPLDKINAGNARLLGLAWSTDLESTRGEEATPIVVDGTMYISTTWSKVMALDAATGKVLWRYDPKVPGEWAVKACCDVVNRGVAFWNGKVYVGTVDGRLACSSVTGAPSMGSAAISARMTPQRGSWIGASTLCPAIRRSTMARFLTTCCLKRRRLHGRVNGGS
jgi:quinohemoprotein ethanol dehydrogenase